MAPNDTPDWTSVTQVETVPGSVVVTGPTMDELYHGRVTAATPKVVTFTAKKSYGYLIVSTDRYLAGTPPAVVRAYDTSLVPTGKTFAVPTFAGPLPRYTPTGLATSGRVGCANRPTDTVAAALYGGSGQYTVWIYGVTGEPPFSVRPDGRNFPVGSLQFGGQHAAGTGVVASPGASPLRLLVRELVVTPGIVSTAAHASTAQVKGMVNGTVVSLAWTAMDQGVGFMGNVRRAPPGGILLDPGANLTYSVAGTGWDQFPTIQGDCTVVV